MLSQGDERERAPVLMGDRGEWGQNNRRGGIIKFSRVVNEFKRGQRGELSANDGPRFWATGDAPGLPVASAALVRGPPRRRCTSGRQEAANSPGRPGLFLREFDAAKVRWFRTINLSVVRWFETFFDLLEAGVR